MPRWCTGKPDYGTLMSAKQISIIKKKEKISLQLLTGAQFIKKVQ